MHNSLEERTIAHKLPRDELPELALPPGDYELDRGPYRYNDEKVLVVVDMEEGAVNGRYHENYLSKRWWKRHQEVVDRIVALGANFSKIVFIVDASFSNRENLKILEDLQPLAARSEIVFKKQNDGSEAVAVFINSGQMVYLCGMNTCACVADTARGLKKLGFSPMVVRDACWDVYAGMKSEYFGKIHNDAISRLKTRHDIESITTADLWEL